jgi:hypothetical protein
VQFTADTNTSASVLGGHAIGYFINNVMGYWDSYPAPYPSDQKTSDGFDLIAGRLLCPQPSNAPAIQCNG